MVLENRTGAIKVERMSQNVCAGESDNRLVRGEKIISPDSNCRVIRWA